MEITGARAADQPILDGISLLPLLDGQLDERPRPMGFWAYPIAGIGTPSAQWMGELLQAQRAGGDLTPAEPSRRAGELPDPPYPEDKFPGHAAWIEGHHKLHRIAGKNGKVVWELYDLAADPTESRNLAAGRDSSELEAPPRLEAWLQSVTRSLNGR